MKKAGGTFGSPKARTNGLFFIHKEPNLPLDVFKIILVFLPIILVFSLFTRMRFYSDLLRQGAVLIGLATELATATPTPSSPPVVDLGYSKYEGTTLNSGVNQYLGLRYAAAPLGSLRFRAPTKPVATSGIQAATAVSIPSPRITNTCI